ncbi:hypothetical protein HYW46_07300 [Candidatus Daviesbacteria bacterium]|nr:hypothetical protein [Candidatus Daviesbacteria bacterium]
MHINLLIKYQNQWVALSPDRKTVITAAKNINDLDKKVKKIQKNNNLIYHHVLPINGNYAP